MNKTQLKNAVIKGAKSTGKFAGKSAVSLTAGSTKLVLNGTNSLVSSNLVTSLATIGGIVGLSCLVPAILPIIIGAEGLNILSKVALGRDVNIMQDARTALNIGNRVTRGIISHTIVPILNGLNRGVDKAKTNINDRIDRL